MHELKVQVDIEFRGRPSRCSRSLSRCWWNWKRGTLQWCWDCGYYRGFYCDTIILSKRYWRHVLQHLLIIINQSWGLLVVQWLAKIRGHMWCLWKFWSKVARQGELQTLIDEITWFFIFLTFLSFPTSLLSPFSGQHTSDRRPSHPVDKLVWHLETNPGRKVIARESLDPFKTSTPILSVAAISVSPSDCPKTAHLGPKSQTEASGVSYYALVGLTPWDVVRVRSDSL